MPINQTPSGEQRSVNGGRVFAACAALNRILERFLPVLTPLAVICGVVFSTAFITLRPLLPLFFAMMTLSGALKLKARELLLTVRRPIPVLFFFLTAHFLMPFTVLFVSRLVFGNDADTVSGYVLVYAVPTAVSGFIWVSIFRGDPALSLTLILLDTLLAPMIVPGSVKLFLGTAVALDMTGMAISLIIMIVIPTIIGVALNEFTRGAVPRAVTPFMSPLSKICIFLVVASNCSAIANQINPRNPRIWLIGGACVCFSVLGFLFGKLSGVIAGRFGLLGDSPESKKTSLFFASGLRNTSAAMTLGIDFFPPAAALPAVLAIVVQQTISALMGKIFMRKPKDE